jgi:hypothetical protein
MPWNWAGAEGFTMSRAISFFRTTALWILLLPIVCSFTGASSNQLVLWANNDTFPVKINLAKLHKWIGGDVVVLPDGTQMMDETHCVMTSKTHLNILADNWDFHNSIESIGDLLLELGEWLSFMPFVWVFVVIDKLRRA